MPNSLGVTWQKNPTDFYFKKSHDTQWGYGGKKKQTQGKHFSFSERPT